jgi:hypothetical protein
MTRQSLLKFALNSIAGVLFLFALHKVYGGRVWTYIGSHLWLVCFLPLVLLFLVLLAHQLYREYRQEPEEQTAQMKVHEP